MRFLILTIIFLRTILAQCKAVPNDSEQSWEEFKSSVEFPSKHRGLPQMNQRALFESIPIADQAEFYETLPDHWDWRDHFQWNPVQNQGECASCWAFATVQTVEAAYAIRYKKQLTLSKQELVECTLASYDHEYRSHGCAFGYTSDAYKYMKKVGVHEEMYYPYTESDNKTCHVNQISTTNQRYKINDFRRLHYDCSDSDLMWALKEYGPVVVGINAESEVWKNYRSGIIRDLMPHATHINHFAVLLGWGHENGVDYWIIRNSYGPAWGEHGHVRIERHHSLAGMNKQAMFPILH